MATTHGHITLIQEDRFTLITDAGQGLLLTLAEGADADAADVRRLYHEQTHVAVDYDGAPGLASGVARAVRPD